MEKVSLLEKVLQNIYDIKEVMTFEFLLSAGVFDAYLIQDDLNASSCLVGSTTD